MQRRPIYLDYLATTPLCDEASEAMIAMLNNQHSPEGAWGNPGSLHHVYGQHAKAKLDWARNTIAGLINANSPEEICFESGSTESINHAIRGLFPHQTRTHIVTSKIEHPAVMETVLACSTEYTLVEPNEFGIVSPEEISQACVPQRTRLVTIMLVNNEVGSVMDIKEICRRVKLVDSDILIHCDASQGVGKVVVDVQEMGVDMLTIAGHKLYGPKGIGALWIREGLAVNSLLAGAGHESKRRAGTENVLLCVGLAEAMRAWDLTRTAELVRLREILFEEISSGLPSGSVKRNGPTSEAQRIPHALSLSFHSSNKSLLRGSEIAARCWSKHQIAFSAGAACHSSVASIPPSRVLKAMRLDDDLARSTIRLSVGRYTTEEEIHRAVRAIVEEVKAMSL